MSMTSTPADVVDSPAVAAAAAHASATTSDHQLSRPNFVFNISTVSVTLILWDFSRGAFLLVNLI